jgi:hypothetical protein
MGRRRKLTKSYINHHSHFIGDCRTISKIKNRRETQDDFNRRIISNWKDFQGYKLDMGQILKLKDRKIPSS